MMFIFHFHCHCHSKNKYPNKEEQLTLAYGSLPFERFSTLFIKTRGCRSCYSSRFVEGNGSEREPNESEIKEIKIPF